MANFVRGVADAVRRSHAVLLVWLVFAAMALVGTANYYEDWRSNWLGFALIPVNISLPWIRYTVSFVPQLAEVGLGYLFITDTRKRWALLMSVGAFLTDVGFDMYYRTQVWTWEGFLAALLVSIIVFTVGSEVFVLVGWSMALELLPDAIEQGAKLGTLLWKTAERFGRFLHRNGNNNGPNERGGRGAPPPLPPVRPITPPATALPPVSRVIDRHRPTIVVPDDLRREGRQ